MGDEEYRKTLQVAQEEFEQLRRRRKLIEERMVKLYKMITQLRFLVDGRIKPEEHLKFTEGCRYILMGSEVSKTPSEIREDLAAIGFPIEKYKNILASIHIVMKRLEANGEVKSQVIDGKKRYIATDKLLPVQGLEVYW